MNTATWRKLSAPIRRRIKLMISRAVGRLVDPTTLLQTLQLELLKGEVLDGIEHMEAYGMTANPPAGFEALTASLGGDRAHTVALAAFHRQYRVRSLAAGEVAIYTDEGDVVHFQRGNKILIDSANEVTINAANKITATTKVAVVNASTSATVTSPAVNVEAGTSCTITSPMTTINGNLTVSGTAAVEGALSSAVSVSDPTGDMSAMRTIYNSHTHGENDVGGQTDATGQAM